jgi:hypothetical protein
MPVHIFQNKRDYDCESKPIHSLHRHLHRNVRYVKENREIYARGQLLEVMGFEGNRTDKVGGWF